MKNIVKIRRKTMKYILSLVLILISLNGYAENEINLFESDQGHGLDSTQDIGYIPFYKDLKFGFSDSTDPQLTFKINNFSYNEGNDGGGGHICKSLAKSYIDNVSLAINSDNNILTDFPEWKSLRYVTNPSLNPGFTFKITDQPIQNCSETANALACSYLKSNTIEINCGDEGFDKLSEIEKYRLLIHEIYWWSDLDDSNYHYSSKLIERLENQKFFSKANLSSKTPFSKKTSVNLQRVNKVKKRDFTHITNDEKGCLSSWSIETKVIAYKGDPNLKNMVVVEMPMPKDLVLAVNISERGKSGDEIVYSKSGSETLLPCSVTLKDISVLHLTGGLRHFPGMSKTKYRGKGIAKLAEPISLKVKTNKGTLSVVNNLTAALMINLYKNGEPIASKIFHPKRSRKDTLFGEVEFRDGSSDSFYDTYWVVHTFYDNDQIYYPMGHPYSIKGTRFYKLH